MSIHLDYDSDGCFQIGDISFALQHTPTLVIFFGLYMVIYFPDDSPIDGDHMVNPGRSPSPQSVVPCLCRAQPRRRLPATIRRRGAIRRQFQRGKPHHLTGKSTTFLWGENISCNGKKNQHTLFWGKTHIMCNVQL